MSLTTPAPIPGVGRPGDEIEVTGTFKLRKQPLSRDGDDPAATADHFTSMIVT